jgi:hypothetical protein
MGTRPEPCAASGVQADGKDGDGGLVSISGDSTTGHVSVVGSTLTDITVRAHCRLPSK